MEVTVTKTHVTIKVPIDKRPSKSGKNLILASSSGNKVTEAEYDGQPVVVGLNVYINKEKNVKK